MPRIQFSDVTPPERRSIRDIPIPDSGKRKVPITIKPEEVKPPLVEPIIINTPVPEKPTPTKTDAYEYYYPKTDKETKSSSTPTKSRTLIFGTTIFLLVGVFIISMMTVFASATVSITPKTSQITVDTKIIAAPSEMVSSTVRYEIIKLSESKTTSIPATGEEAVEIKASGKIVIYNNFSTDPQRLIVRTRFESPEGLIFRIPESVVVPGKTTKEGVETPGSIEVEIFADEAGEKYNIKKTDFTIPGFKSEKDRYKNIYARSATEMVGGFVGKRKVAVESDKQSALKNIDSDLQTSLKDKLTSKIPDGLVLLDGSITFKSKELAQKENSSSVILGKEITAYALVLNKQDLSNTLTNQYLSKLSDWKNIKPIINDFALLKITNKPDNFETNANITIQIAGDTNVMADIDTDLFRQRLAGTTKKDATNLMKEFNGIYSITATIKPVWKQSFPENSAKINVKTITTK